ncbi:MAG: dienelactone hydrolase family protein [Candidatus Omnitrophica bacterium]|nr:dienelactone hydrolase family protein [Candidatus Omnitrophota bacterium]MDD5430188.1 dienelactone hydrolase family protein [Candidatus Omnitrophota bacterium]
MKKSIFIFILFICFVSSVFADTIFLKSGKTVTGEIIEVTNEYVKIDFDGIPIKYWKEDIDTFEEAQEVEYGKSTHYMRYGNEKVRLDIYNPGMGTEKRPIVILIHGSAGITGNRATRYREFGNSLMLRGIIAINVHYFDSQKSNWVKTFIKTIDYAQNIPNADKNKIGIVGYSLGGMIAFRVASGDKRVKLLTVNAGSLPADFTKKDAAALPFTYMISGTKDKSIKSLYILKEWLKELKKPFKTKIDEGMGHTIPMNIFRENWSSIVDFFAGNFNVPY